MKRLALLLFLSVAFSLSYAQKVPKEIKKVKGELLSTVSVDGYEVIKDDKVVSEQRPTKTKMYFYRLSDEDYYWLIKRDTKEEDIGVPKTVQFKVLILDGGTATNRYVFAGYDVKTSVEYRIGVFPWDDYRGWFYILYIGDKGYVYSVLNSNIYVKKLPTE